jgi:signal transduction histidine kinase
MGSHPSATASELARISLPAMLALMAMGVVLAGTAVVVALAGDMPHDVSLAERQAVIVATPIAIGLYAWRDGTHARFGRLLVLAGVAWFLAALSSSSNELLYSFGRVAGWAVEAGLLCLILAFPSGHLRTRIDRLLAAAAVAVVAVLFVPTALIAETYPAPSLFSTCTTDCPQNAFMLLGSEPAWLDDLVVPVRELLASMILLAVVVRLAFRIRRATRLMRRTLVPVLFFAMLRTLSIAVGFGLRRAGADDSVVIVSTTVTDWCLPAMCIGFLVGLLSWRISTADSLFALARGLRNRNGPAESRDVIAATLTDPTVELAFRPVDGGAGWVDADGKPTSLPPPPPDRSATLILDEDEPVAAVIHDAALSDQRGFVEAVGAYVFVWDDNRRLAARVESSLRELRESRARILAAADAERRRIERDLHDGGQQRLVALRIRLELAEELMNRDPSFARTMLHQLGAEVDTAIDELRSLAAGVYPSLLVARGLPDALRTAALQSPVPTSVAVDGSDRYSQEVETAAYFCCVEALQNVAKHAPDAASASISLSRNGDLRFEVRDDGPGFVVGEGATGAGLVNMRDRIAAVGGKLEVRSIPGTGTRVMGRIPVGAHRDPASL